MKEYTLTQNGFSVMEVLAVFSRQLGPDGPSPSELNLTVSEIEGNVIADPVRSDLTRILHLLVSLELLDVEEGV